MKFIVAFRDNGLHKAYKIDDEHKWGHVVDLKIGSEFDGEKVLGEAYKGYVLRVTGGTDENGFPMKNGVLRKTRARLLIPPRTCGLRSGREGERKRRSVRGCIIDRDIGAVHCAVVSKGVAEIAGLTDAKTPRRLGPKRANKIRKLFGLPRHSDNLGRDEKSRQKVKIDRFDVTRYVVKRPTKAKGDKQYYKAPRVQRLVTADRRKRKTLRRTERKAGAEENVKVYKEYVARLLETSLRPQSQPRPPPRPPPRRLPLRPRRRLPPQPRLPLLPRRRLPPCRPLPPPRPPRRPKANK